MDTQKTNSVHASWRGITDAARKSNQTANRILVDEDMSARGLDLPSP